MRTDEPRRAASAVLGYTTKGRKTDNAPRGPFTPLPFRAHELETLVFIAPESYAQLVKSDPRSERWR